MTGKRTVVTEVSTRSPRDDWSRPRSANDALTALDRNGFLSSKCVVGVALVRVCGVMAIRVTVADGRATLETALRQDGQAVKWKPYHQRIGTAPWEVVREALELLATLDVDTPVRWG
jgi:hypothetical protein